MRLHVLGGLTCTPLTLEGMDIDGVGEGGGGGGGEKEGEGQEEEVFRSLLLFTPLRLGQEVKVQSRQTGHHPPTQLYVPNFNPHRRY